MLFFHALVTAPHEAKRGSGDNDDSACSRTHRHGLAAAGALALLPCGGPQRRGGRSCRCASRPCRRCCQGALYLHVDLVVARAGVNGLDAEAVGAVIVDAL